MSAPFFQNPQNLHVQQKVKIYDCKNPDTAKFYVTYPVSNKITTYLGTTTTQDWMTRPDPFSYHLPPSSFFLQTPSLICETNKISSKPAKKETTR